MTALALTELDAATAATEAAIEDPAADLVDIYLAAEAEEAAYAQVAPGPCDREPEPDPETEIEI